MRIGRQFAPIDFDDYLADTSGPVSELDDSDLGADAGRMHLNIRGELDFPENGRQRLELLAAPNAAEETGSVIALLELA